MSAEAGQAVTEHLLIIALIAIAIALGSASPLEQLARALFDHYERLTYAVSLP